LQNSLAQYVIFLDDDVKPEPGCLDAYVRAFRQHPKVSGLA
jgi:GT2 family glycosyltransferase